MSFIIDKFEKNAKKQSCSISGGYSSICVAETVQDALKAGVRVIVMKDCLVDNQNEVDFREMFTSAANKAVFTSSGKVLARLAAPESRKASLGAPELA